MKPDDIGIEPAGRFGLLKALAPASHESVTENLGLRGYCDLAQYLWAEWRFDRRYGVRTEYLVPPEDLGFANEGFGFGSGSGETVRDFGHRAEDDRG